MACNWVLAILPIKVSLAAGTRQGAARASRSSPNTVAAIKYSDLRTENSLLYRQWSGTAPTYFLARVDSGVFPRKSGLWRATALVGGIDVLIAAKSPRVLYAGLTPQ